MPMVAGESNASQALFTISNQVYRAYSAAEFTAWLGSRAILTGALEREPALDFITATEADLEGQRDPEVLEFAASHGRILVSHDTSTMPVHFRNRLRSGHTSPGVVRQRASLGQVVEALLLVWSASVPEEWADQIRYLPSFARHDFRR